MTALGQESAQLQEAYPDSADDIAAKQDEIVTAWGNLKDKVSYRRSFDPFIYLFIYLLFSHNKDYTSITLYKDVARGPQKTTRLVRGGPLVTIILSNRTITTHNNGKDALNIL